MKLRTSPPATRLFSLVELLVVLAILLVLASLISPTLRKAIGNAEAVACMQNLRGIAVSQSMYAEDYSWYACHGKAGSYEELLVPYLRGGSFNRWSKTKSDFSGLPFLCPTIQEKEWYESRYAISVFRFFIKHKSASPIEEDKIGTNQESYGVVSPITQYADYNGNPFSLEDVVFLGDHGSNLTIYRTIGEFIGGAGRSFPHNLGKNVLFMDLHVENVLPDIITNNYITRDN